MRNYKFFLFFPSSAGIWWRNCHDVLERIGMPWNDFWFKKSFNREEMSTTFTKVNGEEGNVLLSRIMDICQQSSDSGRAQYFPPLQFPPFYEKVLVINGYFDSNYHHFLIDSLTRISRHLEFLRSNPDIKIHVRLI